MIRVGVIGAGPNGSAHARYYNECPRSEVAAVADPDRRRAEALAVECDAEPVADYTEFLGDVDAAVISSPNFLHCGQAVRCAEAGVGVYCEKPMGLSAAEARQIAAAVGKASVAFVVGFSVRFTRPIRTLERLVGDGRVGEVISIWSRRLFHMDPSKAAPWRKDHGLSGGLLLEVNVHELDWMMAAGGEVASVFARTRADGPAGPRGNDHVWMVLDFAGGAVGTHEGSWRSATPNFYRGVHGTGGGACTDEWGTKLYFAERGRDREEVPMDERFDLRGHFLDCIEKGIPAVAGVEWGLKVMTVVEAAFQSARTGRVVAVADLAAGSADSA